MIGSDRLNEVLSDVGLRITYPVPWFIGTSCSFRRILSQNGDPVLYPMIAHGDHALPYLDAKDRDLEVILSAPDLITHLPRLMVMAEPSDLEMADEPEYSRERHKVVEMAREGLEEAVGQYSTMSLMEQARQVPMSNKGLQIFDIENGGWSFTSCEGDTIEITAARGRTIASVSVSRYDSHPDLSIEQSTLKLMASTPTLLALLFEALRIVSPIAERLDAHQRMQLVNAQEFVRQFRGR